MNSNLYKDTRVSVFLHDAEQPCGFLHLLSSHVAVHIHVCPKCVIILEIQADVWDRFKEIPPECSLDITVMRRTKKSENNNASGHIWRPSRAMKRKFLLTVFPTHRTPTPSC